MSLEKGHQGRPSTAGDEFCSDSSDNEHGSFGKPHPSSRPPSCPPYRPSSGISRSYPRKTSFAQDEFNRIPDAVLLEKPQLLPARRHNARMSLGALSIDEVTSQRRSRSLYIDASTMNGRASSVSSKRRSWADGPKNSRTMPETPSRPPSGVYTMRETNDSEDGWTTLVRPQSVIQNPILTPLNITQARDRIVRPEMCWYSGLIPMIYQPQIPNPAFFIYPSLDQSEYVEGGGAEGVDEGKTAEYLTPLPLAFLVSGVCLAVLLISLDRTVITTAIPSITNEFKSYDDVGWYGSGYLLTACSFQPIYGRVYTKFDIRWSFLAAVAIFAVGSLICALAPMSSILILGRAVTGCGSAGILTGSFVVVAHSVPMERRPVLTAAVGMMFGVGATIGPLLGGTFTDLISWRWCFWINLPVAAFTFAAMIFCFRSQTKVSGSFFSRLVGLDLLGNALLLTACIQFFLALQFNGQGYSWSSARVLGTLLGSALTLALFLLWQRHEGDRAMMPPRILFQRDVAASCFIAFFLYAGMLVHAYYLPVWFQAIQSSSAINSGVRMIAYMVATALFTLFAGIAVSKTGYIAPPAIVGCAIATIGCGLFTTLVPSTPSSKWLGFEIISAAGFGMAVQQGFTAVQSVLDLEDVPVGVAAVTAFQSLGGAVFIVVGNDVLQNELRKSRIPGVDIEAVIDAGATQFRNFVNPKTLPALIDVYNAALQKVFIVAIPLAGLALVGAFGLEWKKILQQEPSKLDEEEKPKINISDSSVAD